MQSEVVGVAENWGVCCYPDAIQRCNKHLLKERILEFLEWFMWSMVLEGTQGTHRLKNMVFFLAISSWSMTRLNLRMVRIHALNHCMVEKCRVDCFGFHMAVGMLWLSVVNPQNLNNNWNHRFHWPLEIAFFFLHATSRARVRFRVDGAMVEPCEETPSYDCLEAHLCDKRTQVA